MNVVTSVVAEPVGPRESAVVPGLVLAFVERQPDHTSLVDQYEYFAAEAVKIADALQASLPGGLLVVLTGVLLTRSGERHLRVPVRQPKTPGVSITVDELLPDNTVKAVYSGRWNNGWSRVVELPASPLRPRADVTTRLRIVASTDDGPALVSDCPHDPGCLNDQWCVEHREPNSFGTFDVVGYDEVS